MEQISIKNGRVKMKLSMKVHPVADLFPMLPEDELRDLAEDIKLRGQLQPIVLDKPKPEGAILDGRNRFAACELAGVEPEFVVYEGDDPDGYALAVNISRRHMTKGQQAIVVARACLVSRQTIRDAAKQHGMSNQRVGQANVILDFAPDLVDDILGGSGKFDAAYEIAKQRRKEKLERAEDAESIRSEAPDLADAVAEESITLDAAKKELRLRQLDAERAERVAEIDKLLAGRKKPFAERVESEDLTWEEAEQLAKQAKQEFYEAAKRNVQRINEVVGGGWLALQDVLENPDDQFTKVIKDGLTEHALKSIQEIQTSIIAIAHTMEGNK
jgi:ParB/RepB/Spo0J family partition protein